MKRLKVERVVLEVREEGELGSHLDLSYFPDRPAESRVYFTGTPQMTLEVLEELGQLFQSAAELGQKIQTAAEDLFKAHAILGKKSKQ